MLTTHTEYTRINADEITYGGREDKDCQIEPKEITDDDMQPIEHAEMKLLQSISGFPSPKSNVEKSTPPPVP